LISIGAVMPSHRNAATNVSVFQAANGAADHSFALKPPGGWVTQGSVIDGGDIRRLFVLLAQHW